MSEEATSFPWYALYVHSRAEKKVYSYLQDMGIEAYLPMVTKMKKWSDRMKKVEEPLFKSYLFVKVDIKQYYTILGIPGVTRFVCFEHKAVEVPDNQIIAIRKYCDDYDYGENALTQKELHEGQLVQITSGAMMGLKGRLAPIKNKKRLVVYIESVGQYIPVFVPRTKLEAIES